MGVVAWQASHTFVPCQQQLGWARVLHSKTWMGKVSKKSLTKNVLNFFLLLKQIRPKLSPSMFFLCSSCIVDSIHDVVIVLVLLLIGARQLKVENFIFLSNKKLPCQPTFWVPHGSLSWCTFFSTLLSPKMSKKIVLSKFWHCQKDGCMCVCLTRA